MYKDEERRKEYHRKYHKKTWGERKEQHYRMARIRLLEKKKWFLDYKKTLKCKCGESHPACIEFHHRNPKKKDDCVSNMALRGYSKKRILKEIAKCDVMCANCHAKLHYELALKKKTH